MLTRGQRIVAWVQAVLGANAAVLALNLLTGVIAARVLGPEGKGVYNAVIIWPTVFMGLCAVGLSPAFTTLYARRPPEGRRRVFRVAMALAWGWGLTGAGICAWLAPRFLGHLGPEAARLGLVGALVIVPADAVLVATALLAMQEAFPWINAINVGRTIVMVLALGLLTATRHLTARTWAMATWAISFASSLPLLTIGLSRGRRLAPAQVGPPRERWQLAGRLTDLGARYYAIGLASMFNAQLDQMLASARLGARDIGLYGVATSSLSVVGAIGGAFSTVFFPMIAGDRPEEVERRTHAAFRRGSVVFLTAGAAMTLMARPVLQVLYGARYLDAWAAVLALAPAGVCIGCIGVLYQGCYALREFGIPAVGEVVGAASGAVLLFVLIPKWGIVGAGAASSASYVLDLAVVAGLWARRPGRALSNLAPGREDVRVLASIVAQQARRVAGMLPRAAA